MRKKRITIELGEVPYRLLRVLTRGSYAPQPVEEVIERLVDHAQQGVYRPGAWERDWLLQAFGDDWTAYLEPGDPYGRAGCERIFQRPKRGSRWRGEMHNAPPLSPGRNRPHQGGNPYRAPD